MKKISAIILALCMVFALCACGSSSTAATTEESNVLVLGTSADYAPFEFMYPDDNGDMIFGGIDISAAQYIADAMGKELQVENMSFDYLLTALAKGDYDMVMAAIENSEERANAADFSEPYYADGAPVLLIKKENADKYTSIADFDGKLVGAQSGTTRETFVIEEMPNATLTSLQSVIDLVNQLVYDKLDAVVLDGNVAASYLASNSDELTTIATGDEPCYYCVAVQKGDPKGLLEGINAAIEQMNAEGKIAEFETLANSLSDVAVEVSADAPTE